MALQRASRPGEIPKGAVQLNESQALEFIGEKIQTWKPMREVWSYRFGVPALAFVAAMSAGRINRHIRIKLKLKNYALVTTHFTMMLGPAAFAVIPHYVLVTSDVVLKKTKCDLCVQNKAILIQLFAAILYPCVLSPLANLMVSLRHGTYSIPHWNEYRATFRMFSEFMKPFRYKMLGLIAINAFYAGFLTYTEIAQLRKMEIKLAQQEIAKIEGFDNWESEKSEITEL